MSPDKQRIAIANALGYEWRQVPDALYRAWYRGDRFIGSTSDLPQWLNDLNAMHEAETALTEKQELFYLVKLSAAMKESATIGWKAERTYRATAAQRAEAFLRTIGKWEDEPERMNAEASDRP
jgi:hypothetical protein